jgi:hypothetical protein
MFGARLTWSEFRSLRGALLLALGVALCVLCGLVERALSVPNAVDRALARDSLGLLLPLFAYMLFQRVTRAQRLDTLVSVVARHGGRRRQALLGAALVFVAVLALAGAAFGFGTVLSARSFRDPALFRDLFQSTWIGGVSGAGYAAWFAAASGLGRRGGGRKALLAVDWLMGSSLGVEAVPWPRAHVQNLLGQAPLLGLSEPVSLLFLLSFGAGAISLACYRSAD